MGTPYPSVFGRHKIPKPQAVTFDFEALEGRVLTHVMQRMTDATQMAVGKAMAHCLVRCDFNKTVGDEMIQVGNDEMYEWRDEEHALYCAALLEHGPGPAQFTNGVPNVKECMDWAKSIDLWWIDKVWMERPDRPIAADDQMKQAAYEFRRRFLHWCREKPNGQS